MRYKRYNENKASPIKWKKVGLYIAVVVGIVAVGLIVSHEPNIQRECVLFSKGVWSDVCLG